MGGTVEISSALLLRIMRMVRVGKPAGAGAPSPHEWCGILHGRRTADRETVTRAAFAENVSRDPSRAFEIDPAALIAAYRAERRAGALAVLGFFHTHPEGPATPSRRDAAGAAPDGKLWLIASRDAAFVWRAVPAGAVHGRFDRVSFDLRTGSRIEHRCAGVVWRGEELETLVRFDLEAKGAI